MDRVRLILEVLASTGVLGVLVSLAKPEIRRRIAKWLTISLRAVERRTERGEHEAARKAITDWKKQQSILDGLVRDTGAIRATLCHVENGGGLIKPGVSVYSTISAESRKPGVDALIQHWKRVPVEGPHARLIGQLWEEKEFHVRTSDIDEGSVLRAVYQSSKIDRSCGFFIASKPEAMFYLVLNFDAEGDPEAPECVARASLAVVSLLEILRSHHPTVWGATDTDD